jgi:hypothetical protein
LTEHFSLAIIRYILDRYPRIQVRWDQVYCPIATEVGSRENGRRLLRSRSGLRLGTGPSLRAGPLWNVQRIRYDASVESLWWLGEQWRNDKVLLGFLGGLRGLTAPQRASGGGSCLQRLRVLFGCRSSHVSRPIRHADILRKCGDSSDIGWPPRMEAEQWRYPRQGYER